MAFLERCTSQQIATAVLLWNMPVFEQPQLCQTADDCMDLKCLDLILSTTDIFTDAFKTFLKHVIRTHFKEIPKSKLDFLNFIKPRCLLLSRKSNCFYMMLVCSFLGEVVSELYLAFKCCHFMKVAYKCLLCILESRFEEILGTDAGWYELISFCKRMHQFKFPKETKDDESLLQQEFKAAYRCVINFETNQIEVTDLRVSLDESNRDEKNMAESASPEDKKYFISVNSAKTGTQETSVKSFETHQLNTEISTDIEIRDQSPSPSSTEFADILHRDENYSSIENEDTSFKTGHLVLKTQSSDSDQSNSSSSTETVDIFNLDETYISIENQDTSLETRDLDLNTESADIEISDQPRSSSSTEFADILHRDENYSSIENEDTSFKTGHLVLKTQSSDSDQSNSSSSTETVDIFNLDETYISIENQDTSLETRDLDLNTESTDIEISDQPRSSSSIEFADTVHLEESCISIENQDTSFEISHLDLNTEASDIEISDQPRSSSAIEFADTLHLEEGCISIENQDTSFEISHLDLNTGASDIETSNQSHSSSSTEIMGILDLEENYMSIENEDTSFETSHLELNTESADTETSNQSHSSSSTEIADITDLEENYIPNENEDSSFMVGYMDLNTESTDTETSNQSQSSSSTESTDGIHFDENDCYFVHEYRTDREEQYRSLEEQFKWDHGSEEKELYQLITETPDFLSEVVGLLENMKSNSEINIDPNDYDIQVSDTEEIENIERSHTFSKKDSFPREVVLSEKAVESIKEEICKKFYETSKVVRPPDEVTDKNALDFFFDELFKSSDKPECELCSGRGKKYVFNWFERFMESNVNAVSNVFRKFSQYSSTEMGMKYTMMPSW
ncbi:uncharacterized protein TNIN_229271 [Trichonephila inaurata madagascariensis]|uniref:Uncharacterized protein n=1 Tax=Trichonephila inaurata madagascariensis TaxID=2747483 RepID=A0A8X7BZB6_9ARAC|nr:uncharacterized protein TNIN_229271 [Trichonephila inaurata madagascariensis]